MTTQEIQSIINRIDLSSYPQKITIAVDCFNGNPSIRIMMKVKDIHNGKSIEIGNVRALFGSESERHVLDIIYHVIIDMVIHEFREHFKLDGKLYSDPHLQEGK